MSVGSFKEAVVFEALVSIARIFLGSLAYIRILPQHLLKEEGNLRSLWS